jgi:formylglycine-generating enzyme required for sulfatase activity
MPIDSILDLEKYTELKWIEGGSFLFQNKQKVSFDRGFYAGVYPVTQKLYERVMQTNPSQFKGKHRPVERVSWDDINGEKGFLHKLNFLTKDTYDDGLEFHLPTEAMWEYCARNHPWDKEGKAEIERSPYSDFSGSHVLDEVGWYSGDASRQQTQPVGLKEPNLRGLHDMSGDVWEWCEDWHSQEISPHYTNGFSEQEVTKGYCRVVRGGSWDDFDDGCRLLDRAGGIPDYRDGDLGFRLFRY